MRHVLWMSIFQIYLENAVFDKWEMFFMDRLEFVEMNLDETEILVEMI